MSSWNLRRLNFETETETIERKACDQPSHITTIILCICPS